MGDSKTNPLAISVERGDDAATLTVEGEVDLDTSASLRDALADLLDCRAVHLDLSRVEYMDSTGLRTVLVAKEELDAVGGSLDVVAASSIVSRLIEITGVDGLLAG